MADDYEGLEILSIGSLYRGPSEKKYWSTSRGKDRYPYPVGYSARRTFCGETYKIEISESPNGPLFAISSADGGSFSGQTPEIAWNKFQKKGSNSKLLRGKPLSSPCNGKEFFGFKNSLVLRLLRELVTNDNDVQGKENENRNSDLMNSQVPDINTLCVPDSCPFQEDNMATVSDHPSPRNEITNSMMTLLLPQAIPLLKDPSRKRKEEADSIVEGTLKTTGNTEKDACAEEKQSSRTIDPPKAKRPAKVYKRKKSTVPLSETIVHRNQHADEHVGTALRSNIRLGNGSYEFIGCYRLPMKVEWLHIRINASEIFICVVCDSSMENMRTLFHHKLSLEDTKFGVPSLLGHSHFFSDESVSSSVELTSKGDFIIVLGSVRSPHCNNGRTDCNCHACASKCLVGNSVNIIKMNIGYTSVVLNLKGGFELAFRCLLVLSPNVVLASGDGGILHVWIMDATWSFTEDNFFIEGTQSCVVQLKKIPSYDSLVLGHNRTGEFFLWDLSKRTLLSRFSALNVSVVEFSPLCLFEKNLISELEEAIGFELSILGQNGPAVWVLVSTGHKQDWRLGLLAQSKLTLGNVLDPRAVVSHALDGSGVIGTVDGVVYGWELLSGFKIVTLYEFKGGKVSCIASHSSSVAVAEESGNVLVFRR